MFISGNIISGEFDEYKNEFSIEQVKHFDIKTTIKEGQLKCLYQYLLKQENSEEGQVITLYDQMPLKLSQEEVRYFIHDLEAIKSLYF